MCVLDEFCGVDHQLQDERLTPLIIRRIQSGSVSDGEQFALRPKDRSRAARQRGVRCPEVLRLMDCDRLIILDASARAISALLGFGPAGA